MTVTAPFMERRELAHRTSDGIEVSLFWSKATNRVTLEILDLRAGQRLEVDIAGHAALNAFYHPFAYAASHTPSAGGRTTNTTPKEIP